MRPVQRLSLLIFIAGTVSLPLFAQPLPRNEQATLYFPHFADGGPVGGQWQTRFTVINPNTSPATVALHFYADDGADLLLDFGNGKASTLTFAVPPGGTFVAQSRSSAGAFIGGWAGCLPSSRCESR